jgi:two-component system sensor histidine kinase HydH
MRKGPLFVVGTVFLTSLATLVASSALAQWSSIDEFAARDRLQDAAMQLADASSDVVATLPPDAPGSILPEPDNRRLAGIVGRVLANYAEAEGGFYLAGSDQFAGVVIPVLEPDPSAEKGKKVKGDDKKGDKKTAKREIATTKTTGRRDPPPMETDQIRQQVRAALNLETGSPPIVEIRDIGPSRVAFATTAVGTERPAKVAVWVMVRLTGPEQQKARLGRLQLATGLSLVGILLALGLAAGLVRSLQKESRRQQKLRDELRKAEYMAALGRLLAGVAHEVRNPLTAIRSTVQLWERLPDHARTPESFAAVVTTVDRLNLLVDRLLLFARAGHETRRPVDLNAVAGETLELIHARAQAQGVKIESDLVPDIPRVVGSVQALGQVLLNLATNALQAMPAGGRLLCSTRILPDSRLELVMADTGPGVPENARDRIFEPFFTTRPDGTGLGLALCREVARQHGGDVTLVLNTGCGASFRLILPVAPGDTP